MGCYLPRRKNFLTKSSCFLSGLAKHWDSSKQKPKGKEVLAPKETYRCVKSWPCFLHIMGTNLNAPVGSRRCPLRPRRLGATKAAVSQVGHSAALIRSGSPRFTTKAKTMLSKLMVVLLLPLLALGSCEACNAFRFKDWPPNAR